MIREEGRDGSRKPGTQVGGEEKWIWVEDICVGAVGGAEARETTEKHFDDWNEVFGPVPKG